MPELHVLPTPGEAADAAAAFVADLADEHGSAAGRFTIALSGGSTPRLLYQALACDPYAAGMAWDRWHVFWSDERCLPPDYDESNYRMTREALLDRVYIPAQQIHRIRGEIEPEEAAAAYGNVVVDTFGNTSPSFDLILLGIGEDGHTASLFPGTEALRERRKLVAANWAPHLQAHRITFTLPLINMAKNVAFLANDESKAEVLRDVLEPSQGEDTLPAAMVRPAQGMIHWFVTTDAASLLKTN